MKLIKKDKNSIDKYLCCSECKDKENITQFGKIHNDDICYLCPKCLIKAVLMVRPIAWHKGVINGILDNKLETLKYLSDGKAIDLVKFIDWLLPFLESK